jgi:hypothetical protein
MSDETGDATTTPQSSYPRAQRTDSPLLVPWQKGQSGNPAGRKPLGASLKELAQNQPVERRAAFVLHVLDSAMASSSATAARWAQLFADISGDGGASFKLELEPGGKWAEIMASVRERLGIDEQGKVVMIEGESQVVEEKGDGSAEV